MKQSAAIGSSAVPSCKGNEPSDGAERRANKRFTVSASAEMLEPQTSTRLNGRVSDLGIGGCYIDTVSPFPVGTSLLLSLTSENHSVRVKANVVYAHTGMGMGLVFTEMTAHQRQNLNAWLLELSGEMPKGPAGGAVNVSDFPKPAVEGASLEARSTGLRNAFQELIVLLGNRRVLSEEEIELLRLKMSE